MYILIKAEKEGHYEKFETSQREKKKKVYKNGYSVLTTEMSDIFKVLRNKCLVTNILYQGKIYFR